MKSAMTQGFVPSHYKQRSYLQFTKLVQRSKSVIEYMSLFNNLATRYKYSLG